VSRKIGIPRHRPDDRKRTTLDEPDEALQLVAPGDDTLGALLCSRVGQQHKAIGHADGAPGLGLAHVALRKASHPTGRQTGSSSPGLTSPETTSAAAVRHARSRRQLVGTAIRGITTRATTSGYNSRREIGAIGHEVRREIGRRRWRSGARAPPPSAARARDVPRTVPRMERDSSPAHGTGGVT